MQTNRPFCLVLATLLVLTTASHATAYIDAGSGSFLWQLAAAGFLGSIFALKTAFGNIKLSINRLLGRRRQASDEA